MNESMQTTLRKLRLSGLAQSLDVRLQEATGNQLTHAEFLELILQDELAVRADRLIQRRVKAARFRDTRTLEDFDFAFNTSINKKQVYDLATCRFIREPIRALSREKSPGPCALTSRFIWVSRSRSSHSHCSYSAIKSPAGCCFSSEAQR